MDWGEICEWMLNGDDRPDYQLERLQYLVEDAEGKYFDDECDMEWLEDEFVARHESLQRGWDEFAGVLEKLECASNRQGYREQQRHLDTALLQAALNARVAYSIGARSSYGWWVHVWPVQAGLLCL